ncbi:short coiled-coil protein homolog [Lepeophtheirus salmonis]|uniref:Short coiledcoil protein Blike [Megachile rotundata] n=1 Tax=Lepeophtheirus salmonis TaxID=72036 RepID=A0A0K2SZP4_LEPSM|nr:short coiled-coil protein homolog [Lepeophtheirus salmonis]
MAMQKENYVDDEEEDEDSIPLADDDPDVLLTESEKIEESQARGLSLDSIPSVFSDDFPPPCSSSFSGSNMGISSTMNKFAEDSQKESSEEAEEKARLIAQVLELQNTLDDLTTRVDTVKEENLKLQTENSILGQYIQNLMEASAVFQAVSPGRNKGPAKKNIGTVIRVTAKAVQEASSKE